MRLLSRGSHLASSTKVRGPGICCCASWKAIQILPSSLRNGNPGYKFEMHDKLYNLYNPTIWKLRKVPAGALGLLQFFFSLNLALREYIGSIRKCDCIDIYPLTGGEAWDQNIMVIPVHRSGIYSSSVSTRRMLKNWVWHSRTTIGVDHQLRTT
jgi:hypothetical protein